MRIVTKEYIEMLKNSDSAIGEILRTPPSDLTQCKKEADKFAEWILVEHEKDKAIITKALASVRA